MGARVAQADAEEGTDRVFRPVVRGEDAPRKGK